MEPDKLQISDFRPGVYSLEEYLQKSAADKTGVLPYFYSTFKPRSFDRIEVGDEFKDALRTGGDARVNAVRNAADVALKVSQSAARSSFFANAAAGLGQAISGVNMDSAELERIRAFAASARERATDATMSSVQASEIIPAEINENIARVVEQQRISELGTERVFKDNELDRADAAATSRSTAEQSAAGMGVNLVTTEAKMKNDAMDSLSNQTRSRADIINAEANRTRANMDSTSQASMTAQNKVFGDLASVGQLLPEIARDIATKRPGALRRFIAGVGGETFLSAEEMQAIENSTTGLADAVKTISNSLLQKINDLGMHPQLTAPYTRMALDLQNATAGLGKNPTVQDVEMMLGRLRASSWGEFLPGTGGSGATPSTKEAIDMGEKAFGAIIPQETAAKMGVVAQVPEGAKAVSVIKADTFKTADRSQIDALVGTHAGNPESYVGFDKGDGVVRYAPASSMPAVYASIQTGIKKEVALANRTLYSTLGTQQPIYDADGRSSLNRTPYAIDTTKVLEIKPIIQTGEDIWITNYVYDGRPVKKQHATQAEAQAEVAEVHKAWSTLNGS